MGDLGSFSVDEAVAIVSLGVPFVSEASETTSRDAESVPLRASNEMSDLGNFIAGLDAERNDPRAERDEKHAAMLD